MTRPVIVRRATSDDAHGIAAVHVQAWRETYGHIVPADYLAGLDVDARASRWRRILADVDSPSAAFVALDGSGRIIGWASVGVGRDEDAPCPLELEGIYVLASAHGSGAGQALHDAALGTRPAYLWKADDNPRAESFYRRNGFTRDGAAKQKPLGPVLADVVRMVR